MENSWNCVFGFLWEPCSGHLHSNRLPPKQLQESSISADVTLKSMEKTVSGLK